MQDFNSSRTRKKSPKRRLPSTFSSDSAQSGYQPPAYNPPAVATAGAPSHPARGRVSGDKLAAEDALIRASVRRMMSLNPPGFEGTVEGSFDSLEQQLGLMPMQVNPTHYRWNKYQQYLDRLWDSTRKFYPGANEEAPEAHPLWHHEPIPGSTGDHTSDNVLGAAMVEEGEDDQVYYSPEVWLHGYGRKAVPVHEWAHVYQDPTIPPKYKEGGASAFEENVMDRIGARGVPQSDQYQRWLEEVKRRFGTDWINKHQFQYGYPQHGIFSR